MLWEQQSLLRQSCDEPGFFSPLSHRKAQKAPNKNLFFSLGNQVQPLSLSASLVVEHNSNSQPQDENETIYSGGKMYIRSI